MCCVFLSWNLIFWTDIGLRLPAVVTSNRNTCTLFAPAAFQVRSGCAANPLTHIFCILLGLNVSAPKRKLGRTVRAVEERAVKQ